MMSERPAKSSDAAIVVSCDVNLRATEIGLPDCGRRCELLSSGFDCTFVNNEQVFPPTPTRKRKKPQDYSRMVTATTLEELLYGRR
jgi:hypothetical protein